MQIQNSSDSVLIRRRLPTGGQLRDDFLISGIKKEISHSFFTPVYQPDPEALNQLPD